MFLQPHSSSMDTVIQNRGQAALQGRPAGVQTSVVSSSAPWGDSGAGGNLTSVQEAVTATSGQFGCGQPNTTDRAAAYRGVDLRGGFDQITCDALLCGQGATPAPVIKTLELMTRLATAGGRFAKLR